MTRSRSGVLAILAFALAVTTGAQNPRAQAGSSAQANASAGASVDVSSQNQSGARDQRANTRSTSASADSNSSASASAGDNSLVVPDGSRMNATLLTTLDAKHCKPGDRVMARTTQNVKQNGKVVMHKGTRLVGHVTEASARSKDHAESTLGVVFDRAVLRDGQEVPLHLSIQAIAAAANPTSANFDDDEAALASSGQAGLAEARAAAPTGGLVRGAGNVPPGGVENTAGDVAGNAGGIVNSAAGATTRSATSAVAGAPGATAGLNAEGLLATNSNGVFGLNGLKLTSAVNSATDASVVTSTTRNVHLASGTQMVLQVVGR